MIKIRKEQDMRFIFKILAMPVMLVVCFIRLFLKGATKVYCLMAGIAINLLAICSVLAVITQQWFALGVFGILFVAILAVLYGAGVFMVVLDNVKEVLR